VSYTPLSNAFYLALAGFDSAMAAGGRPVTSTEDATYERQALAAFAFAREFDTQWGATEPDFLETYMIPVCTEAYWRGRDDGSVDPAHYEQTAAEIIAIIREADAIAIAGGATPPAAPGGGLALASGWAAATGSFDSAGEVLTSLTLTPESTGLLHVTALSSLSVNEGDSDVLGTLYITTGEGNVDGSTSPFTLSIEVPSAQANSPGFTSDLDRGSPAFVAPVGVPVVVNFCGKTVSGTLAGVFTLSVQERSE
jgi:hypothetical protein